MNQARELHRLGLFVGLARTARFTARQMQVFRDEVAGGWCAAMAYHHARQTPA